MVTDNEVLEFIKKTQGGMDLALMMRDGTNVGDFQRALIDIVKAVQREAFETAASRAWIHYMDTCAAKKTSPADNQHWLCSHIIRAMIPPRT